MLRLLTLQNRNARPGSGAPRTQDLARKSPLSQRRALLTVSGFSFDIRVPPFEIPHVFRPCIDLHQGKVKQLVGGTLGEDLAQLRTNFVSDRPATWFAELS
jgi:hypothetical protein